MSEIKYIQFHSKSKLLHKTHVLPEDALRRLSNFSEDVVVIYKYELYNLFKYSNCDIYIFLTAEHAFQGIKYLYSNKPDLIKSFCDGTYETALDAKKAGGKNGMKKVGATLDIHKWKLNSYDIMKSIIEYKILNNKNIQNILKIACKNNIRFIHFSRNDMYWGAHFDNDTKKIKKGLNKLGEIYNNYIETFLLKKYTEIKCNNEKICDIEKVHETHYRIILNNNKIISISLSDDKICCEQFGIYIYNNNLLIQSLSEMNDAEITNIKISEIYTVENDCGEDGVNIDIILTTTKGEYKFMLYNNHNGYYRHEYNICISLDKETNFTGKL
jgi:predicted NAD-dependent protein-ADP-ribosyltransferase YbiA (DUF1768 family)